MLIIYAQLKVYISKNNKYQNKSEYFDINQLFKFDMFCIPLSRDDGDDDETVVEQDTEITCQIFVSKLNSCWYFMIHFSF